MVDCPMHPFNGEEWLPVLDEHGQDTGDIVILTLIPVGTPSEARVPVVLVSLGFFSLDERAWGL